MSVDTDHGVPRTIATREWIERLRERIAISTDPHEVHRWTRAIRDAERLLSEPSSGGGTDA